MKLAIADPPYLGRATLWYGTGMHPSKRSRDRGGTSRLTSIAPADHHSESHIWDDVATHAQLVQRLVSDYDGWAIAMAHDNLRTYLPLVPAGVPLRIGIWHRPQSLPGGARVVNAWEPVLVRIPEGRRAPNGPTSIRDHIRAALVHNGFAGAKRATWTRWVLDMLGYDQDTDTVADLFPGSGAVSAEVAQLVMDL